MKFHHHVGRLQQVAHQLAENGSTAPPWDRWRLVGVIRGKPFLQPLAAAGTAVLPRWQPPGCALELFVMDTLSLAGRACAPLKIDPSLTKMRP
jgi:hypothetical protein